MMTLTNIYKQANHYDEVYKRFLAGDHKDAGTFKNWRDELANEYRKRGGKRKFAWE